MIRLAIEMQASSTGLCLDDVEQRFDVTRRTAMRLLDAVKALDLGADYRTGDDGKRYWRLPRGAAAGLVGWSAVELAALDTAAARARQQGLDEQAELLERTATKLRGLVKAPAAAALETDLAALIEAEGLVAHPGPRPHIEGRILADLRQAILACRKVRLHYRRRDGEAVAHKVYPYGFLYGSRHCLVAWSRPAGKQLLYRLGNVQRVEILDEFFERDPAFEIERFARQAFGVFQEDAVDVVWRFAPEAAEDARQFCFHPDQRLEDLPDGSLRVSFRAGGRLEMAWHLFTWGPFVEVEAPDALRRLLVEQLEAALKAHARESG